MLQDHEKLQIPGISVEAKPLQLEVNYRGTEDKKTNGCKILRVRLGREETHIKFEDLWNLMFLMASSEKQDKMIPVSLHRIRHVERVITVEANRDVKRGEKITFTYRMKIPDEMFVENSGGTLIKSGA